MTRKLDGVLHNEHWSTCFLMLTVHFLNPLILDHHPRLVTSSSCKPITRSTFKFFDFWTNLSAYEGVVRSCWACDIRGNPMFALSKKLKGLRFELQTLNKLHFWDISKKVRRSSWRILSRPLWPVLPSMNCWHKSKNSLHSMSHL